MSKTKNLDLVVTDDDSELFENWRNNLNGTADSNMTKLDAFAGKFNEGQSNQYISKNSSSSYDFKWETPDSLPTQDSKKLIESGAVFTVINKIRNDIEKVDNGKKVIVDTSGEVSQLLSPDIFYDFTGEITTLSITMDLASDARENEYKGQFVVGSTLPTINFPTDIVWIGGFPTIAINKTYQFSILNNIGIMVGV